MSLGAEGGASEALGGLLDLVMDGEGASELRAEEERLHGRHLRLQAARAVLLQQQL